MKIRGIEVIKPILRNPSQNLSKLILVAVERTEVM